MLGHGFDMVLAQGFELTTIEAIADLLHRHAARGTIVAEEPELAATGFVRLFPNGPHPALTPYKLGW